MAARKRRVSPPPATHSPFPIVGVGASAGGLDAFRQMLGALPADSGMAFVLVQHLSPTHSSLLSAILSRITPMPVTEIKGEPQVEPNHVYVIPPDCDMVIVKGVLQLLPREQAPHRPIDLFFRSLAQDQGPMAMGVILSGTASDGTLGLQEIKAAGGITFAQDDSAQQSSMPRSAVASGCVDFVLAPNEIAHEIARIARHPLVARGPTAKSIEPLHQREDAADLSAVLQRLLDVTGVDFTQYKPNTFHRRLTRRLVLHQMKSMQDYAQRFSVDEAEVRALYQDLLINVTSFFRDAEMFEVLKARVFPALFAGRPRQRPLRVWVPGCSTGEEAYSLAIAIAEFAEIRGEPLAAQIFATDLNGMVIETARKGTYAKSISHDVSPGRLRRFFVETDDCYAIVKTIREQCVFARHNILSDPPFSQIDLISCRNLLIYLEPSTQKLIAPLLHYALMPNGFLVLGSAEATAASELFEVEDSRYKIFRSKPGVKRLHLAAAGRQPAEGFERSAIRSHRGGGAMGDLYQQAERALLAKYAPPSVVVDANYDILQFHGDTEPFLAPTPGRASLNLLRMVRKGLQATLRSALSEAGKSGAAIRQEGLSLDSRGESQVVHLEVSRLAADSAGGGAFLVVFEPAASRTGLPTTTEPAAAAMVADMPDDDARAAQFARLAEELRVTREHLRSVIDQQNTVNEDLQSTSEELQSANEELQSINEELETSKEEIQSANEELSTLNDELQNRNRDLNLHANDMVNLLGSVDTAILMLGPDLCIRRFTPAAVKILHLIPADLGLPISHVKLGIDLPDLESLLTEVLATVSVVEREVQDAKGHWYLLRVRPYQTLENRIDGAVIMLVDIDRLKSADQFAKKIVATVREGLLVLNARLEVQTASRSFYQTFRMTPEQTEGHLLYDLGDGRPWDSTALRQRLDEVLADSGAFEGFELDQEFDRIGRRVLLLNARRLAQQSGDSPSILFAIEDVTERRALEEALSRRVEELAAADRSKNEFLALLAHELRNPLAPLRNSLHLFKAPGADEAVTAQALNVMHRQIHKMARLIDDLLDVSRITRGSVLLRPETVELASLLRRVVEAMQPEFEARGEQLTLTLPPQPFYLHADSTRLEQIFGNLLHNAAKFTGAGGNVELTAYVESTDQSGGAADAVIHVRDDGIGIAPDMLPHVFELFMQAQRSLDRSKGGLGIGLTLVKSLVELHEGTVEAYSRGLELGSEFVVRLPLATNAMLPAEEMISLTTEPTDAAGRQRRRVLVVDDNVDTAESLALLLRLRGHQVEIAFSGPAALEVAMSFEPEVVLLDIGLPGLDGYEVAARIRQDARLSAAILVALTGYGQEADRRRARDAGFDHHLTKPVDPPVIYRLLEEVATTTLPARPGTSP